MLKHVMARSDFNRIKPGLECIAMTQHENMLGRLLPVLLAKCVSCLLRTVELRSTQTVYRDDLYSEFDMDPTSMRGSVTDH